MLGEAALRELHVDPTDRTKLGVFLMIFCSELTLIFLSFEFELLEVIEERFEETCTLARDCKARQVTTNFETASLCDVRCGILADGVNGVPFTKDRQKLVLGRVDITGSLGNTLL